MKKIILSIAVSAIALSCNKKQSNPTGGNIEPTINKEVVGSGPNKASRTNPTYRIFFKSTYFWVCIASGGNCLPEVIVKPKIEGLINGMIDVVGTNNQTDIQNYFTKNKDELTKYAESGDVEGVISGDLIASTETNPELNIKYLVLKKA
ncbi:MAG: hypothetical protein V4506_12300, partial [Bacteroidota bacterium]